MPTTKSVARARFANLEQIAIIAENSKQLQNKIRDISNNYLRTQATVLLQITSLRFLTFHFSFTSTHTHLFHVLI